MIILDSTCGVLTFKKVYLEKLNWPKLEATSTGGTTTTIEIPLDELSFENDDVLDYLTEMKARLERHQQEQEKEEELTRGRKRKRQQRKKIMFFTPSKL